MILKHKLIFLFVTLAYLTQSNAQVQDSTLITRSTMQIIEEFVESTEVEGFDFTDMSITLEAYLRKPLNLNRATREELEQFPFLDALEIDGILKYRNQFEKFLSIYELQAVPELEFSKAVLLSNFTQISDNTFELDKNLWQRFSKARKEIMFNTTGILQERKGYKSINGEDPKYLGTPYRHYLRFRGNFENRLSYGFAAEKDMGEPWQKLGFDFYTAHIFIKDVNTRIKAIALGDYNISLGQGLILHTGFGRGKSVFATQTKKGGYTLRPSTGVNEYLYFRGAAATVKLSKNFEATLFGSFRYIDGSVRIDSLESGDEDVYFSSIQRSGLHRTQSEFDNKNAISNTSLGGNIKYTRHRFSVGLNTLYDRFSHPLRYQDTPANKYRFNGTELLNTSLDYTFIHRNIHFYGETAMSDNGGIATLNGLLMGVHPKANLAIVQRYFSPDYQNINGNSFSESITPINERGIYLGTEIKPNYNWNVSFYGDFWHHPWLKFNVDAPSYGKEFLGRITYKVRRKMETYLHFRYEEKERNFRPDGEFVNQLRPRMRQQMRWHIEYIVTKDLVLRNRIELTRAGNVMSGDLSNGFMILQDIIYKPSLQPFTFSGRIALFQTDDYDSRIYAYENDLLYHFSIPPYYGQGIRTYLNLRVTAIRNFYIEARIANTKYFNQETIGSGNDEISGSNRTDARLQILYRF